MEVSVDGKVALVTGASRGIGEAVARGLLDSGVRGVVVTGRRDENLAEAKVRLGDSDRVEAIAARADTEEGAQAAVAVAIGAVWGLRHPGE